MEDLGNFLLILFVIALALFWIVSLWKVYDKHTKELMIELYRNILSGKGYSEALRGAKLEMISDPATAFPNKWGGFVLIGR